MAQDRRPGDARLGAGGGAAPSWLRMWASSAAVSLAIRSGTSYQGIQKASQTRPAIPAATNAERQPNESAIQGTTAGAMMAPTLLPLLKSAVA